MTREEFLHNLHPGTMLKLDFLGDPEMNLTAYRLAKSIGISQTHLAQILDGRRSVTASLSLRLGRFFDQSPDFWINLQRQYDIEKAKDELGDRLDSIVPFSQISHIAHQSRRKKGPEAA